MFKAELINRGNHRMVWTAQDPQVVVKMPRYNTRFTSDNGVKHNLQEWEIYQKVPAQIRRWLCRPVALEYGGLVLVMERGEPIEKGQAPVGPAVPGVIRKNDNTWPNWVMVNGVLKRCDYHALYKYLKKEGVV